MHNKMEIQKQAQKWQNFLLFETRKTDRQQSYTRAISDHVDDLLFILSCAFLFSKWICSFTVVARISFVVEKYGQKVFNIDW